MCQLFRYIICDTYSTVESTYQSYGNRSFALLVPHHYHAQLFMSYKRFLKLVGFLKLVEREIFIDDTRAIIGRRILRVGLMISLFFALYAYIRTSTSINKSKTHPVGYRLPDR